MPSSEPRKFTKDRGNSIPRTTLNVPFRVTQEELDELTELAYLDGYGKNIEKFLAEAVREGLVNLRNRIHEEQAIEIEWRGL